MDMWFFCSQSSKVKGTNEAEQSEMCKLQNIVKVRQELWQTSLLLCFILGDFAYGHMICESS